MNPELDLFTPLARTTDPLVGPVDRRTGRVLLDGGLFAIMEDAEPQARSRRKDIPRRVRKAIYERDGHQCVECGSMQRLTLDHVVPFCRGGADDQDNLRTLCLRCNSRRNFRSRE